MKYIERNASLITGKENLEHLYTFKDFPVFLWCVDHPQSEDILADMSWSICPESGMIQLDKVLPLEILYQLPHNDWVWKTWEEYYIAFAEYIKNQWVKNILEIWGGGWKVALNFTKVCDDGKWFMVEPNPLIESDQRIKIIKTFFDENFVLDDEIDAIVHSQVFEHAYNPMEFILNISKFLKVWQKHIIAFPDIEWFMNHKYTNAMNFEHTYFLNENFADYFFINSWFKILDKTHYKWYDLFYTLEKVDIWNILYIENKYTDYKQIFLDFISYHEELISWLNEKIEKYDWEIYMFWAHIFSQYLLGFGLNSKNITCILDNSDLKNWKRLYGTTLIVKKPSVIRGKWKCAVILKAAIYQEEIRKQLLEINPNIEIWE